MHDVAQSGRYEGQNKEETKGFAHSVLALKQIRVCERDAMLRFLVNAFCHLPVADRCSTATLHRYAAGEQAIARVVECRDPGRDAEAWMRRKEAHDVMWMVWM